MKKTRKATQLPSPARLKLALHAAYLSTLGMKYAAIGGILFPEKSRCEAEISRLIKIARKERYLTSVLNPLLVSPEKLEELPGLLMRGQWDDLQRQLIAVSNGSLINVYVFPSGTHEPTSDAERARQAVQFAAAAAAQTFRLLAKCRNGLAVCWGPTIWEIGSALERHRALSAGRLPVMKFPVFPTVGLPPELHQTATEWSSTSVARIISRALRMSHDVPSLDPISPVLIGASAVEPARTAIINYLKSQPGYRAVFGARDQAGLVDQADGLITGAGTNSRWPRFGNDAMQVEGISADVLQELTLGDIGGVLISATDGGGERFKQLRKHWTGLTLKHIKRINENADITGGPGVVLCAIGSSKAEIIHELIAHHQVVRHLVIDHQLARALVERLQRGRVD